MALEKQFKLEAAEKPKAIQPFAQRRQKFIAAVEKQLAGVPDDGTSTLWLREWFDIDNSTFCIDLEPHVSRSIYNAVAVLFRDILSILIGYHESQDVFLCARRIVVHDW
ncbi:hypothetical protein PH5382_03701 [Phaeobacter sp. CECT 5382]|uniref:hypothetical protein n=1 Tax=Phaeobacter sp. CECT 5382 TaxID=1712645 RepID=UPI0006D97CDB|nr:hypothetical protein [Phaeobacter sp. CECT 5382]CUH89748.1 hypothetical protein PH5382_03701 [Phaeobacter sp. CECT 5382]